MSASSLFSRLLIAAALVVGAPLITVAVAPGVAQAADFTGRIKRVKIKKRRVGEGYKVRTVGEVAGAGAVAGGSTIIRSAETGEVVTEAGLGDARRGRLNAFNDNGLFEDLAEGESDTVSINYRVGDVQSDGSIGEERAPIVIPVHLTATGTGAWRGDGVGEGGWKARARINRQGTFSVTILHENHRWAGDGIEELRIEGPQGVAELSIESVTQAFVANVNTDLESVGLLEVEARLEMEDGSVITRTDIVDPDPQPAEPRLNRITVSETRNGRAKIVTITQGGDLGIASVLVAAGSDDETSVSEASLEGARVSTVRHYFHGGLEFEAGDDPAGTVYLLLVDMLDANGDPVGEQQEVEVAIPAYVEGEATVTSVLFGDGQGMVTVGRDAEGIYFGLGLKGSPAIDSANFIFEEPFDGPAPLETEINVTFGGQTSKWVHKSDGALPDDFTLNTVMTNANGQVVGGTTVSGGGTGVVYSNGKGTRPAAGQVKMQQNTVVALL